MYFFINHNASLTQSSIQAYGPSSSNEFNCTSKFSVSAVNKAFAAQTGLMIVQDAGSGRVNVALKPLNNLGQGKPSVGLYIYRGLDKDNFVDGSGNLIAHTDQTNKTDFTAEIWEADNAYHGTYSATLGGEVIGYDGTLAGSTTLESIFEGSQTAKAQMVQEGMFIGNWVNDSSDIGFEVLLLNYDFLSDLDYLRAADHKIDVSSISNNLEKKAKREECLLFMDPAALYGLHYYDGVTAEDGSLTETTYTEQVTFYTSLIQHFYTKNRVYIDIRSEYGYSYNFYENYHDGSGNQVKLGDSLNTATAKAFASSDWPILYRDTAPNTSTALSDFLLALRMKDNGANPDNAKPLVFYNTTEKTPAQGEAKWAFIDDVVLTNNGANSAWTTEMTFQFPNYDNGGTKVNMAWFVRLHYARQEPYTGSNTKIPKVEDVNHQFFGPFDPSIVGATTGFQKKVLPMPRLVYGEMPGTAAKYAFVGFLEIYWNAQGIVFGISPDSSFVSSNEQVDSAAYGEKYRIDVDSYDKSKRKSLPWFSGQEVDVVDAGQNLTINLLALDAFETSNPEKEKVQVMGLTTTEFDTLKNRTGLSDFHGKFLKLGTVTNIHTDPDVSSVPVEIVGLDTSENYATGTGGANVKTYF